jgi:D-xylose transport system substrate-binding protein
MDKKILIGVIVGVIVLALIVGAVIYIPKLQNTSSEKTGEGVFIGFSLGTLQEERWQKDRAAFTAEAERLGAVVDVQGANNNIDQQISQIRAMIAEGVDVLVIAPYDAKSLVDVINEAHTAGIKVISYDRLITGVNADIYLSFDNEKVGEFEAQYILDAVQSKLGQGKKLKFVYIGGSLTDNNALLLKEGAFKMLQPEIDNGNIEVVYNNFTQDWNPEIAYGNMKSYLQKSNGAVDAVVCANDGTAFGAITALGEYNLSGKIPVSGQDAELSACQRVVQGTQTVTVYKPIPKLAAEGVALAIQFAKGENVVTTRTVNNGQKDIPSVLLEPIAVTKGNIDDTVIKDGYQTREEVYQG